MKLRFRVPFVSIVLLSMVLPSWFAAPAHATGVPTPSDHLAVMDRPMAQVWPVANAWNDAMEREYQTFVAALGEAVRDRRCVHIDECLRDPRVNTLFDPATDAHFHLRVDCADLPYVLRAYFAFKRRLPFGWVSSLQGVGHDDRYMIDVRPNHWMTWRNFPTPHELLAQIGSIVHSGMYRIAPDVEDGDFYQTAVDCRAIHPGSIFYDPNGHVLVVTEVRSDGQVYMMDGHPDGSLTYKRFGEAFVTGTARLGGGFKNFRPLVWHDGQIERVSNRRLPMFDGHTQFDHAAAHHPGPTYHQWIRTSLAEANVIVDPVVDFREEVAALCRDVSDRADAVNLAVAAHLPDRPHPAALPENIYGTDGEWEQFSSPSRDARLKASFRELRNTVAALAPTPALASQLRTVWREETARPGCQVAYVNSAGTTVTLTMDQVLDRLFAVSFDPYACPELRWGAPDGSPERATCRADVTERIWYADEQRLRNRIDREYGQPTPLSFGPDVAPDVDVRRTWSTVPPSAPTDTNVRMATQPVATPTPAATPPPPVRPHGVPAVVHATRRGMAAWVSFGSLAALGSIFVVRRRRKGQRHVLRVSHPPRTLRGT